MTLASTIVMLSSRVLAILRNFMTWILIVFLLKEN